LPTDWLSNLKDAFKEQKQDLLAKVQGDQKTVESFAA